MFLFEQMFDTALNGVAGAGLMDTILRVAYGILLASLLFAAYEAWARGGDVRALGGAAVKYLALGLLFANNGAMYDSLFRSVVTAFNQMAHTMAGPGDVLSNWRNELAAAVSWPTLLNLVTGITAGVVSALLLLIAMILYPVCYAVFTILYTLFGTILYTAGPLVLALMPSLGLGGLARRFAINFAIFASWGLIYGVFCRLLLAVNMNSMAAISGAGSLGGLMVGATAEVLLAAASILFAACIVLIPFLAKRIVEGDVGSAMMAVLGATAAMAQQTMSAIAGSASGYLATSGSAGGASAAGRASSQAASTGSGGAPPAPAEAPAGSNGGNGAPAGPQGRGISEHRPVNLPYAVGWLAGAAAAIGVKGVRSATRSSSE